MKRSERIKELEIKYKPYGASLIADIRDAEFVHDAYFLLSEVKRLRGALETLVYECGSYGPKDRREYLKMGPMLEPSEKAVLDGRKALTDEEEK